MPPLRPLPDLCLISVFKMLTPNEQLVANKMSPRCAILVRAANRTLKTLVITSKDYDEEYCLMDLKLIISYFSLASRPSMQKLMNSMPGVTFPDYPMTTARVSKWNCLMINRQQIQMLDTATIHQIVTIFSAVTDLKFMMANSSDNINNLVSLLQHPNWQCQLTNLLVPVSYEMSIQLAAELATAINGLTALQLLALGWETYTEVPDLSILAQLKTVVFKTCYKEGITSLLPSLERNAAGNADLQVHLHTNNAETLLSLSQPLHSRIVCCHFYPLNYPGAPLSLFCSQFRFLTSLSIGSRVSTNVRQLFSDLSQLHQLIHLILYVDFSKVKKEEFPLPARPLVQLKSLLALELHLRITSHSQIEWLNLPWTMPNLKIIHIEELKCGSCKVRFFNFYYSHPPSPISSSAVACFRASLFNLHPGVRLKQFIVRTSEYTEPLSAEDLLLQSE